MREVRNVTLITVDCLRADHLPVYGYDRDTAPFLTALANQSVLFENAFATGPGTSVSFPSIFTSTYPFEYGGYDKLSSERTPVASVVSEADVDTIGVHSNTYLSRTFGYERGFDIYESFYDRSGGVVRLENVIRDRLDEDGIPFRLLKYVYELILGSSDSGVSLPYEQADSITDTAINHLTDVSSPFFLWTHYMDVHAPHHPPDRYFETFGGEPPDWERHHDEWLAAKEEPSAVSDETIQRFVNAYDAEIRFVDEQIERLFEEMKRLGVHDNTLYIVTADHGELLGEHNDFSHPPRLYDELTHVPLFVHLPGVTEDRTIRELVSLIDVPTTITDAFDVAAPRTYRGVSLLPAINEEMSAHEYVFAEVCHRPTEGMSAGSYDPTKAIVSCRGTDGKLVRDEQRDTETVSIVDEDGIRPDTDGILEEDQVGAFRGAIVDHLQEIETTDRQQESVDIDEGTAARLRDLGYVE
jgi:arylsulfatase A-like enzyme